MAFNRFLHLHDSDANAVAIEDPTLQRGTRTKGNNPRSIAVMSMAVGVAVGEVLKRWPSHAVAFIPVDEWMTRVPMRKGKLTYTMPKPMLIRYLMTQIKMPAGVSEHVIAAAGVARYWIEQERRNERLRPTA